MSRHVPPSRALDAVYDPVYSVSTSGGAFRRGVFRAASKSASTSSGPASGAGDPTLGYERVSGAERAKFFKRPVLPHLQAERPEVLLAPPPHSNNNSVSGGGGAKAKGGGIDRSASEEADGSGSGMRSVGVQTAFRDSEAQTDPYSPDFTAKQGGGGSAPELAALAHLKHREGQLPAGLAEVELVERRRAKRAFEAALPPMTDEASFLLRKRMLEAQETREWAYREQEIDALHAQRVALLRAALAARDQEHEFLAEQRVDALRQARAHELENARERLQQQRVAALRRLAKKRQQQQQQQQQQPQPLGGARRRDLVAEYADFGSRVYAPATRDGASGGGGGGGGGGVREAGVETRAFRELDALRELAAAVPARLLAPAALHPPEKLPPRSAKERKQAAVEAHLLKMETLLKNQARHAEEDAAADADTDADASAPRERRAVSPARSPSSPLRLGQPQTALVRPPTPDYADRTSVDDEAASEAARLLQQLVRGRAVQNMMFDGRARRAELLAELRASTAASASASASTGAAADAEALAAATRRRAEGEVVSELLDTLAKALDRAREVDKLRAFVGRAADERRAREVNEGGRRQAEELAREREDAVFRALSRVHLETAGALADDAVAREVAREALAQAQRELLVRREGGVERLVAALESEMDTDAAVVRELVASFLLPQVRREQVRRQVAHEQRKFQTAAHALLQAAAAAAAAAAGGGGGDGGGERRPPPHEAQPQSPPADG